jgi:hypothetical protein
MEATCSNALGHYWADDLGAGICNGASLHFYRGRSGAELMFEGGTDRDAAAAHSGSKNLVEMPPQRKTTPTGFYAAFTVAGYTCVRFLAVGGLDMLKYWLAHLHPAVLVVGTLVVSIWLTSCSSSSSGLCPTAPSIGPTGVLANCSNRTGPPAPLIVTSGPLPGGVVGEAYNTSLFQASGGTGGYTWSWAAAAGSSLPPGLSLMRLVLTPPGQGNQAYISGDPTAAGTYLVILTVTDFGYPSQRANATYKITIAPSPPPPKPDST